MALCIVNTSGEGTIDTDVNKVYAKNILAHTMDSTNPHGRRQTQDELDVVESLTVKGYNVNGVMYATAMTAGDGNAVNVVLPFPAGSPINCSRRSVGFASSSFLCP